MSDQRFNNNYLHAYPSAQNAIDIFKGEWSSELPKSLSATSGGQADLFEDQRIVWAEKKGLDFQNKRILELGPLEGGHTWMMAQRGAREIVAIEAHERAFLKCLVIKDAMGMDNARFLHGDFELFLNENQELFDICVSSGVLYHSKDPIKLLDNLCRCCNQILLWSHYYDDAIIRSKEDLFERFAEPTIESYQGNSITLHPFSYTKEINREAFCGGLQKSSNWLEKEGIENIFKLNEFRINATGFDHPNHPNGPAIAYLVNRN